MVCRVALSLLLVAGSALAGGCATYADRLGAIRASYCAGDLVRARAQVEDYRKGHRREADVLQMEEATLLLCEGRAQEAERCLRAVRDRFDYLEQKDLAEGTLALLTDDQRLAYAGADYEKVLIRVYLTLSSLLGDGQDAGAYALQVAAKQDEIIAAAAGSDGTNPKEGYARVAAGPYLHAALREETHAHYDDAARDLELVCHWAPAFHAGAQDLARARTGRHSARGNGVLYVVALTGRGPYKEEHWEIPTQAALLVADRIVSAVAKHYVPPTLAPIKVPRVVTPWNSVQAVAVTVDGQACGQTETLTDVARLAVQQDEATRAEVLGRAVARRVLKKGVVYGVKEVSGQDGGLPSLALDAAGVVWEAAESADTRCWGLLPEKIQVLRLELPAGDHQLALQAVSAPGCPQGGVYTTTLAIADGRNTYVLASFPTGQLVGQINRSLGGRGSQ